MARPRTFDEDNVLSGAMHCFRRTGFRNASVKDLEKATGLTSGSLYNAYGDKDGLFRAAFRHYLSTVVLPRMEAFAGEDRGLADLEQLYLSLFEQPYADGFGCLVVNSSVEFGGGPSVAQDGVREGLDAVGKAIRTVIARHLSSNLAEPATQRLMLIYQGLLVASRAGRAGPDVASAIRAEFDILRSLSTPPSNPGEQPC